MIPATRRLAVIILLATSGPASAGDDCPERFEAYGHFLQARTSCAREVEYPQMKAMRACAKATPKETALGLMDGGRRRWAREVMRSSLGRMCEITLAHLPQGSERRKR